MRQFLRRVEREWWRERIEECENACNSGRMGEMYKILKEIGRKEWKAPPSVGITVEEFKEHFEKVSEMRYEVDPAVIGRVIGEVRDLRGCEKAREANECMNGELVREEIEEAMKEMRESAPGEDGVRMCYLKEACEEVKEALIGMVQFMFEERVHKWDEWLKEGALMCPLFKKGDRREKGNYRGVVLLAMGSRVLARVCAKRMRWWAEHLNLMDENQWGFREGRSTADVTQVIVRMKEDADDYAKRVGRTGGEAREENDRMVA